jgi:pyruvate dehydrogenase E2 component (dihydrolipoamide acetyltransferase)
MQSCKNLGEISAEVKTLAQKAKEASSQEKNTLVARFPSPTSVCSVFGFTGVINPPQAGILCIGGIEDVPVVKDGHVVAGKVMTITLSADHRVDGPMVLSLSKRSKGT